MLHEETLETALTLLRFHLVHNVLAFHDVRLQRQHRPALAENGALDTAWTGRWPKPSSVKPHSLDSDP